MTRSRKGESQARTGVALLARQIADELFTCGTGEQADRLELLVMGPERRSLGRWSRRAVVDRIQMALMRGRYKR